MAIPPSSPPIIFVDAEFVFQRADGFKNQRAHRYLFVNTKGLTYKNPLSTGQ